MDKFLILAILLNDLTALCLPKLVFPLPQLALHKMPSVLQSSCELAELPIAL
jgi:hypothetical protein